MVADASGRFARFTQRALLLLGKMIIDVRSGFEFK